MSWRRGERVNRRQWRKVRLKVLDRDSWRCQKCGKAGRLEVDHVKPLEDGGALYDLHNLQSLCRSPCHFEKSRSELRGRETDPEVAKWRVVSQFEMGITYQMTLAADNRLRG